MILGLATIFGAVTSRSSTVGQRNLSQCDRLIYALNRHREPTTIWIRGIYGGTARRLQEVCDFGHWDFGPDGLLVEKTLRAL